MKADRRLGYGTVILAIAVGCWGCKESPPAAAVEVAEAHRMSPPLLLSEVHEAAQPAGLLDADFSLENHTPTPQPVSLTGKSCSCYGVMLDGEAWETGATFTVAPGTQRRLTFDVKPPAEPSEKSWSVRLTSGVFSPSGASPSVEQVLTLGVRVYDDVTLQPQALFATIPTATVPTTAIPALPAPKSRRRDGAASSATGAGHGAATGNGARRRLVIRRTWRRSDSSATAPRITGLPAWASVSSPVAISAPQEIAPGLWQQSWETHIEFDFSPPNGGRTEDRESLAALSAGSNQEAAHAPDNPSAPDAVRAPGSRQATVQPGLFRFHAAFADAGETTAKVTGRIALERSPGVVAPSVVHWGQIPQGSARKRRLVLSAGDERPFHIEGVTLLESDNSSGGVASPPPSDDSESRRQPVAGVLAHRLVSPFVDLTVGVGQEEAAVRQSVALELVPLQAGRLDTTLVFATDHPLTPFLKVRLRAAVHEAAPSVEAPGGG